MWSGAAALALPLPRQRWPSTRARRRTSSTIIDGRNGLLLYYASRPAAFHVVVNPTTRGGGPRFLRRARGRRSRCRCSTPCVSQLFEVLCFMGWLPKSTIAACESQNADASSKVTIRPLKARTHPAGGRKLDADDYERATSGLCRRTAEPQCMRSSWSTLVWQLTVVVTTAPTSRAGLCTSTVDGDWNAHLACIALAFEAAVAKFRSTIPTR